MKALVVTPFSPAEANAGHRVRLAQVNDFLRTFCTEIHCLFTPFEGAHRWKLDTPELEQVQKLFNRLYVLPADSAGKIPEDGNTHHLDEWFDPLFQNFLEALARKTSYHLIVVHNVWLSKAFSYFPPAAIKWLELHDLFHLRAEAFNRIGVKPDFFAPTKEAELFGMTRADIAVAIGVEEYRYVRRAISGSRTLPWYLPCDPVPEQDVGHDLTHTEYLSKDKVTFGILGSSHPFNVDGATRLCNSLIKAVGRSMAPVEVLVAGQLGKTLASDVRLRGLVKSLGYVEDLNQFYDAVDYVLVPVFDGSGVNIKLTEAVRRGAAVIASNKVLEQAGLTSHRGFQGPEAMALEMCRIAMTRPSKTSYLLQSKRESFRLVEERLLQQNRLLAEIRKRRNALVMNLAAVADPQIEAFAFMAFVSLARQFQGLLEFTAVVSEASKQRLDRLKPVLPNYFSYLSDIAEATAPIRRILLLDPVTRPASELQIEEFFRPLEHKPAAGALFGKILDARRLSEEAPGSWKVFSYLISLFGDNTLWDPGISAIAREISQNPLEAPQFYCIGDQGSPFVDFCAGYVRHVLPRDQQRQVEFVATDRAVPVVLASMLMGMGAASGRGQIVTLGENEILESVLTRSPFLARHLPAKPVSTISEFNAVVESVGR